MRLPFKTVLSGDREAVAKLSFVVRTVLQGFICIPCG
jgi:hypothetical protein